MMNDVLLSLGICQNNGCSGVTEDLLHSKARQNTYSCHGLSPLCFLDGSQVTQNHSEWCNALMI